MEKENKVTLEASKTSKSVTIDVALNRIEGDLEVRVALEDGRVADAWSAGTLYRGFENILVGRGATDGLVITPRICGICSTSHLVAAALALDNLARVEVPDNARRLRNVALMVELLQSDVRHAFLMFAVDFTSPRHAAHPLHAEAQHRYRPLHGRTTFETIEETRSLLDVIALLGGQWPHSSFMVPGGVVSTPSVGDLLLCRQRVARFRQWYERRVLGCTLERWLEVSSAEQLDAWLGASDDHASSELGFFLRFCRGAGLDRIGRGHGNFLSFGGLEMPHETCVQAGGRSHLLPAGLARGSRVEELDPGSIEEHVSHSWFLDDGLPRHPFEGKTEPYASGQDGQSYSWVKAPRYAGLPAETGPLAERIVAGDPLYLGLLEREGASVVTRQLARLSRAAHLLPPLDAWLSELTSSPAPFYRDPGPIPDGRASGLIQAPRGALGHWIEIQDGKIARYQILSPTTWNGSPRDAHGVRGPWEEALVGIEVGDVQDPVELGHVVRSFDPCLVCSVHAFSGGIRCGKVRA
jgi:uptake hydrogenase large subunit